MRVRMRVTPAFLERLVFRHSSLPFLIRPLSRMRRQQRRRRRRRLSRECVAYAHTHRRGVYYTAEHIYYTFLAPGNPSLQLRDFARPSTYISIYPAAAATRKPENIKYERLTYKC